MQLMTCSPSPSATFSPEVFSDVTGGSSNYWSSTQHSNHPSTNHTSDSSSPTSASGIIYAVAPYTSSCPQQQATVPVTSPTPSSFAFQNYQNLSQHPPAAVAPFTGFLTSPAPRSGSAASPAVGDYAALAAALGIYRCTAAAAAAAAAVAATPGASGFVVDQLSSSSPLTELGGIDSVSAERTFAAGGGYIGLPHPLHQHHQHQHHHHQQHQHAQNPYHFQYLSRQGHQQLTDETASSAHSPVGESLAELRQRAREHHRMQQAVVDVAAVGCAPERLDGPIGGVRTEIDWFRR